MRKLVTILGPGWSASGGLAFIVMGRHSHCQSVFAFAMGRIRAGGAGTILSLVLCCCGCVMVSLSSSSASATLDKSQLQVVRYNQLSSSLIPPEPQPESKKSTSTLPVLEKSLVPSSSGSIERYWTPEWPPKRRPKSKRTLLKRLRALIHRNRVRNQDQHATEYQPHYSRDHESYSYKDLSSNELVKSDSHGHGQNGHDHDYNIDGTWHESEKPPAPSWLQYEFSEPAKLHHDNHEMNGHRYHHETEGTEMVKVKELEREREPSEVNSGDKFLAASVLAIIVSGLGILFFTIVAYVGMIVQNKGPRREREAEGEAAEEETELSLDNLKKGLYSIHLHFHEKPEEKKGGKKKKEEERESKKEKAADIMEFIREIIATDAYAHHLAAGSMALTGYGLEELTGGGEAVKGTRKRRDDVDAKPTPVSPVSPVTTNGKGAL